MHCLQLVVEKDTKMNAGMQGHFDLPHDEFSLAMTAEGMDVARALEGSRTDWMLSRLRMPVMDGFHYLSYLAGRHFALPIVLSNAPDSASSQHYLLAPRASSRRSPLRDPGFNTLPGLAGRPSPAHTARHGVTLLDFLRFCVEQRQTRVLEVSAGSQTAVLHLTFGRLFHARSNEREGLPVFLEVMGWKAPALRILPTLPGLHTSITEDMEALLSQAQAVQQRQRPTPLPEVRPLQASEPQPPASVFQRVVSWASRLGRRQGWAALLLWGRMHSDRRLVAVLSNGRGARAGSAAR